MYQRPEISILKLRFEEYSKFNETIKENSAICFFFNYRTMHTIFKRVCYQLFTVAIDHWRC